MPTNGDELREQAYQKFLRELPAGTPEDEVQYQAGMYLYQLNRSPEYLEQAAKLFTLAISHETVFAHKEAAYMLGKMHMRGIGGLEQDREKALSLFMESSYSKYQKAINAMTYLSVIQIHEAQIQEAVQNGKIINDDAAEAWLIDLVVKDDAGAIYEAHELGTSLNTPFGDTLVSIAVEKGSVKVIAALKAAGADLDTPCKGVGVAPLFIAIARANVALVEALVEAGADITITARGAHKTTLLDFARTNKKADPDIIGLLQRHLLLIAEQGNAKAQFMLGGEYYNKKNVALAKKWFNKAKLKGHADATLMLEKIDQEVDEILVKLPIVRSQAKKGDNSAQRALEDIPSEIFSIEAERRDQQLLSAMNKIQFQHNTKEDGVAPRRSSQPEVAVQKLEKKKPTRKSDQAESGNKREESPKADAPRSETVPPKTLFSNMLQTKKAARIDLCSKIRSQAANSQAVQIKELQDAIAKAIMTSSNILAQPLKEGVNNAKNKDRLCKLETNLRDLGALEVRITSIKAQKKIISDALVLFKAFQEKSTHPKILRLTQKLGSVDTKEKSESIFTIEEFLELQALIKNDGANDEAYTRGVTILEKKWKLLLAADKKISMHIDELRNLRSLLEKRAHEHSEFETCLLESPDFIASGKLPKIQEIHRTITTTMTKVGITEEKTAQDRVEKPQKTVVLQDSANRLIERVRHITPESREQAQQVADRKPQTESASLTAKKLSKTDRKKAYEAEQAAKARIAARKKVEKAKEVVLRQLVQKHAAKQIAIEHNEFERRKPQERKITVDDPELLFKEETIDLFKVLQKLKSIIKVITGTKVFKAQEIYAILEVFGYLNDIVSGQHTDLVIRVVAQTLRHNIFHKYMQSKCTQSGQNLLEMVNAWIRFLETTEKMRFGAKPEEVLAQVSSEPLSAIYRLEETDTIEESCDAFEEMMKFGRHQRYEKDCSICLVLRVGSNLQTRVKKGHEIIIAPEDNTYIVYYKNKNNCELAFFHCNEEQRALLSKLMFNDKTLVRDSSADAQDTYKQIYAAISLKEGCTRFGDDIIGCEAARFYWAITGAERGKLEQAAKAKHARASALLKQFGSQAFRPEHLDRGKAARHFIVLPSEEPKRPAEETKCAHEAVNRGSDDTDFFEGLLFARPMHGVSVSLNPSNVDARLAGNLLPAQDASTSSMTPAATFVFPNDAEEQNTQNAFSGQIVLPGASACVFNEPVVKTGSPKHNGT